MAALTIEQREAKKREYDKNFCMEICNKIKKKMRFSMNVEAKDGKKITKDEIEALNFGFNEAVRLSILAINEVLKEYGV